MASSDSSFGQYVFNLVLFFPIDQIRRWAQVICTVNGRLVIWCEKIDVKHWMNVTSRQGRSLDVSLVIDLQGQNKKARVLSASYEE